jgi:tetratricopeptide (TPR) repeat protein
MGLVEDLREELARGEVLVVVGTGVSIQATGGAECAKWDGLIRNGIEYAAGRNLLTDDAARRLRNRLEKKTVKDLLGVAQKVSEALGAPDGGEFRRWLRESVGKLDLKDRSIIDAIHALGAPIATTNYDDLLTCDRGMEHVPWTDVPAAQEILRNHRQAVLHLHGCFDHPQSVVLGVRSYASILKSQGAQAIQQALAANKSFLFIGCGEGLSDPNFGALLEWIDAAFGRSIYRHYRLCLKSEKTPPEGRLFPVPYGDGYGDLVPFLRDLAPRKRAFTLPSPGYCFGREREVEEVVTGLLADNPQPLPILGGPGMGKTTIALKALHDKRVAERFRERRWFVRCEGVKTRTELAAAIARELDLLLTPNVEQSVLAALEAAPAALVLDNGETPLDADGAAVEELLSLLAAVESLALVMTIRGLRRPRGVPWRPDTEAERLPDSVAKEVFVAVSGKPKFADDPHLTGLLVALDGVPLAITLMGRYAESFDSLELVWSRWKSKRTAMLKDGLAPTRLTDIAVSYELSIGVLGETARRLLSVLALLPDGVAHRDLEGVFVDPDDAADELRRRALVFDEGERMRMQAPLREYVAGTHPTDPVGERKVVDHYLDLAANEGQKIGRTGGAEAVARLAVEVANVEVALGKSTAASDTAIGQTVYGWATLMRFTGLGSTGPIAQIAATAMTGGRIQVAAQSLENLGDVALDRSDHEMARARYEQAQPLYRQVGAVLGEANCIKRLGDVALDRSDHETARARYEEAQPLYRQVEAVVGEANCIRRLGDIALERSDHETARARYEEAQPLYRQVGDVLGEANCILSLGEIALRCSDHEKARVRYEEAQPLYRQVGSVRGEASCIRGLGHIALSRADYETARAHYEQARPLYQQVGYVLGEANCIRGLGDTASAEGQRDEAVPRYRAALALYERIPEPYSIGDTHRQLARLATDEGSRTAHVTAAREAWRSIKRDDLVAELDAEFDDDDA